MKVKVNNEKDFEPIELTITIESKEELNNLFARLNLGLGVLEESTFDRKPVKSRLKELYDTLEYFCEKRL